MWLRSGVSPDEVYKMMPVGAEKSLMDGVRKTNDVDVLVHALLQWDALDAEMKQMENYRKFISSFRPPFK
uniref:RxLR effector candidate protein n=1 Tax=Hyaloperonospora arabidopsidis (strain Emoy2) TaxID=559515 RepID=M4BKD6_HYAAE